VGAREALEAPAMPTSNPANCTRGLLSRLPTIMPQSSIGGWCRECPNNRRRDVVVLPPSWLPMSWGIAA
jgi:hypothetical protein